MRLALLGSGCGESRATSTIFTARSACPGGLPNLLSTMGVIETCSSSVQDGFAGF